MNEKGEFQLNNEKVNNSKTDKTIILHKNLKMGQAWCKDQTSKVQDSKSPIDRVFLRCAHRIYPGLKEEGSIIGGATQRVTSSEIGYAGSPPRELLTRGRSIDSVDRPFQPSDWVDVNLEVPSTPRASPVNLTMDTAVFSTTILPSSYSNSRDIPIPPPRRNKKNYSRTLSPKSNDGNKKCRNIEVETLYSSVTSKVRNNYVKNKNENDERKLIRDIYEHKINGRETVIPSKVVSSWKSAEKISSHQRLSEVYNYRYKNTSTASLPNYDELEASKQGMSSKIINGIVNKDSFQHDLKSSKNEKSEVKTNVIETEQIDSDEVDSSFEITRQLRLNTGKTSTPVKRNGGDFKNSIKVDGWFLHADRSTRYSDSPSVQERTKMIDEIVTNESKDQKSCAPYYLFSDGNKLSYSDPFNETEDERKTNSLDRYREFELKKSHGRTLSRESESFDSFEERHSSIEPTHCRESSSLKLLTKSISEESFPSALMEDPDEVDFFDEKIVKDTKNEITKIREELEVVKNEVKTPPPSPEPIITPELQSNDHSILLKVLREEAHESNLSSMTPSLTELEAALSDMLEKEEDQIDAREGNCKLSVITKSVEEMKEPKIVPSIVDGTAIEIVDFDLRNGEIMIDLPKSGNSLYDDSKSSKCNSLKNDHIDTPEKPSRIYKFSLDPLNNSGSIPIPPRRRNRSNSSGLKDNSVPDCHSTDRLI